jgi:hypothetical protein
MAIGARDPVLQPGHPRARSVYRGALTSAARGAAAFGVVAAVVLTPADPAVRELSCP